MMGVMVSPLTGADGNVEFLAHLRARQPAPSGPPIDFGWPLAADAAVQRRPGAGDLTMAVIGFGHPRAAGR